MLKRKWVENLDSWENFTYVKLKGVPMKRGKNGGVIDFDNKKISRLVSQAILKGSVPIHGKELKLLRTTAQLSMHKLAVRLGVTSTAIYHWEKEPDRRLMPMSEAAIRLLCAEELGVELKLSFSKLIGDSRVNVLEVIVTNKKPSAKTVKTKTVLRPSYRGDRKIKVRIDEDL